MNKTEILNNLYEAFAHELYNSMVYIRNSFVINDCDPSRVTEAIAVDEMRHMWWIADLIVKRGGKPKMDHEKLVFGGDELEEMLSQQIVLETEAIKMYKKMISTIDDPEVVGVMKHALDEERRHRKEFKDRLKK
ncbi:MAG: ferritin-like domain-containing protein [Candidatus Bathyarchaeota archaeon]